MSSNQKIKLVFMELDTAYFRLQSTSILPQQEEKMGTICATTCEIFISAFIDFLAQSRNLVK